MRIYIHVYMNIKMFIQQNQPPQPHLKAATSRKIITPAAAAAKYLVGMMYVAYMVGVEFTIA